MRRVCSVSRKPFEISDGDLNFYRSIGVPPPTRAPLERLRRRISFRNFRNLYHRECSATGKKIISMYDNKAPFPVVDKEYWWSDNWNARELGRTYEIDKSFFEQFEALDHRVPRAALISTNCENSDYSNMALQSKDCYLVFGCVRDEHCLYGHIVWDCEFCLDNLYAYRCKWCSNCTDIVDCYETHYSSECSSCAESFFLYDCHNCRNCFGGFNMRNKQYCFFGKQMLREEYAAAISAYLPLTHEKAALCSSWLERACSESAVSPQWFSLNCEECSGNHLYECCKVEHSFDAKQCEESRYLYTTFGSSHCLDMSFVGARCSFCYECLTSGNCTDCICSHLITDCVNTAYSQCCVSCHDVFGCSGLKGAQYCILNRQYTKEDYVILRAKIISRLEQASEWGEFFPANLSPFAYNESIASEYLPLSETQAKQIGYRWKDPQEVGEPPNLQAKDKSPNTACCVRTGRSFRLTPQETELCDRMGVPRPELCPGERHLDRMSKRAKRELVTTRCYVCKKAISAAPAATAKITCDECHRKLLYS